MTILLIIQRYSKRYLYSEIVELQGLSYMVFFKHKLSDLTLVSCVHVEKIPEFSSTNQVNLFIGVSNNLFSGESIQICSCDKNIGFNK